MLESDEVHCQTLDNIEHRTWSLSQSPAGHHSSRQPSTPTITETMELVAFLDTSALLPAFARWLADETSAPPLFLRDPRARRFTFEKCVFEAFVAFRGVGGKKPDEGRGDWAERHLRGDLRRVVVNHLSSTVHGGNTSLALFWLNNIQGTIASDAAQNDVRLRELLDRRDEYERLCQRFQQFLEHHAVGTLLYGQVFGSLRTDGVHLDPRFDHGLNIDNLVRTAAIPSEDLEIVVAAERLAADIFVTEDNRLRRCAWSLGLNHRLSAASFCGASNEAYEAKVRQCLTGEKMSDEW